eukprot:scaffold859_cov18-Tisochrysis_lutea.AAC.3
MEVKTWKAAFSSSVITIEPLNILCTAMQTQYDRGQGMAAKRENRKKRACQVWLRALREGP